MIKKKYKSKFDYIHSYKTSSIPDGYTGRIHHGINLARDAVQQVSKTKSGCGLLDLDFLAGFDWLDMAWVYLVLAKKGLSERVIERIRNVYSDSISVVMVNNVQGRAFPNLRGSLRQGDIPSMYWFAAGIDPLLLYLEKRLKGIPLTSLPVLGPTMQHEASPNPTYQYGVQCSIQSSMLL